MQTKSCPDCGDDIALRAKRCKCGWQEVAQINPHRQIKSDPAELARSYELYRGPTEAEQIASKEYPKPATPGGTWWAKRILRLTELGVDLSLSSILAAQQVLGVKTAAELRDRERPTNHHDAAERIAIQTEPA